MGKKRDQAANKSAKKKSHKRRIFLTSTGLALLSKIAKKAALSKSALVEQIALGSIAIASPQANKTINLITTETLEKEATNIEIVTDPQPALKEEISNVEKQLALEKSHLAQQAASYEALNTELQQQISLNQQLQQQLKQTQGLVAQEAASNRSLQQKIQAQSTQIENLEKKLTELQSLARIGESQLNKWRKF
ncbi:MAG: hypothetical protein DSM107014_00235 [Gomphosphaeria aponina SAG 52.96 = DSM 107014]|uniref:Uncharacterized protein n=1 Tax=Gomphosphaeria aponina SAG 52.96 = DSM 107014 TaxID=1521640 RepID=A0A941GWE3_9CHRO|nr:hypothetical protein [Gomphosphaeria aponina SAG 52.96 = DSM 107014]